MKLLKNKRGQSVFVGIMIFVMAFIVLVQFIDPMKDQIISARAPENLDCDNTSISAAQKGTCVITSFSMFYFFGGGLAAAGAVLFGKVIRDRAK